VEPRVFYSWQSDLPDDSNREYLRTILAAASERLTTRRPKGHAVVLDSDTLGVPGAPPITEAVLEKIRNARVFVADVSITNSSAAGKKAPNPNVLVELGYALRGLGWSRILMLMNTEFGEPRELPFDLHHLRVEPYRLKPKALPSTVHPGDFSARVEAAIETILRVSEQVEEERLTATQRERANPLRVELLRKNLNITATLHEYRLSVLLQPIEEHPVADFDVELSFPRGLIAKDLGLAAAVYEGPRGPQKRDTFRVSSKVVGQVFPGEPTAVLHVPYRVNDEVFDNNTLMQDEIQVVVYVPGKEPARLAKKVADMQVY
jgi:hypothetical protein